MGSGGVERRREEGGGEETKRGEGGVEWIGEEWRQTVFICSLPTPALKEWH